MMNHGVGVPSEALVPEKGEWAVGVMFAWSADLRGLCIMLGKRLLVFGAWDTD